jgi:hypothetical protein
MGWTSDKSGFNSRQDEESRQDLGPTQLSVPGDLGEIGIEHYSKTNRDPYHYFNPFGRTCR